jgi:hypothetical protein
VIFLKLVASARLSQALCTSSLLTLVNASDCLLRSSIIEKLDLIPLR